MTISVYIDNNVWDVLFKLQIDLAVELPRDDFCVCVTREAQFEIPPIPAKKAPLKAFIEETIKRCSIRTDLYFGFYDESVPLSEQRMGGFDVGRWATQEEIDFFRQQTTPLRGRIKNPKTKLLKDEADISVAARSFHSVVLSLDRKAGPINDAYKQGGKVVYLTDFENSGMSLREFIKSFVRQ